MLYKNNIIDIYMYVYVCISVCIVSVRVYMLYF